MALAVLEPSRPSGHRRAMLVAGILSGGEAAHDRDAHAGHPSNDLQERLLAPPTCVPRCA